MTITKLYAIKIKGKYPISDGYYVSDLMIASTSSDQRIRLFYSKHEAEKLLSHINVKFSDAVRSGNMNAQIENMVMITIGNPRLHMLDTEYNVLHMSAAEYNFIRSDPLHYIDWPKWHPFSILSKALIG